MRDLSLLIVALLIVGNTTASGAAQTTRSATAPYITTFSIVAWDPETGDFGVAVQSRYFAVGAVVPHATAEVGAVATQARGNLLYGPEGLSLLGSGIAAEEVLERLLVADPQRDERQVGIVDKLGRAASYTGEKCLPWSGGRVGRHYAVQGNLLAGPQVVDAMAAAFEVASGEFPDRLMYALTAGQAAGGDARGRQSAALLVVRKEGGYLGLTDRYIDLHVEDHATPIHELLRLLHIRQAQLATARATEILDRAEQAEEGSRAELLGQAREQMLHALELDPDDDYGWWVLARIHLLEGDAQAAADAAQRALLENPSWRRLPASTRASLGVPPQLIEALQDVESFRQVWSSLAPEAAPIAR